MLAHIQQPPVPGEAYDLSTTGGLQCKKVVREPSLGSSEINGTCNSQNNTMLIWLALSGIKSRAPTFAPRRANSRNPQRAISSKSRGSPLRPMSCTQVAAAAKSAIASIDKRECRKEGPMDTCVREYIPCRVCGCFLLQFCSNVQGPREGKRKLGGGAEQCRILSDPIVLPATASCGQPSSSPFDPHTDWTVCLREYSMHIEF